MEYSVQTLNDLAWQVEIGADEALGDVPGLLHWQGKAKPPAVSYPTKEAEKAPPSFSQAKPRLHAGEAPAKTIVKPFAAQASMPPLHVKATTIEGLKQEILAYEGCELKHMAINTVFADGNPKAEIMFIGDAPNEDEDRTGIPFAGKSGELMDRMLQAIGLEREKVYLTNLVFWRPPGNRTLTEVEIAACLPFTRQHIALVQPKILVLMGSLSAKNLLHATASFSKLRGSWREYALASGGAEPQSIPCLPMYHPTYLLRQPAAKRLAWADLLEIKKEVNELPR